MTSEPVPQRLSDADRDTAASLLREHYEAGRLDDTEFSERLDVVLGARYATEFGAVFADLPDPHPSGAGPAVGWGQPTAAANWAPTGSGLEPRPAPPVPEGIAKHLGMAQALLWPVAIGLALVTGDWILWIVIAIIGGIVLKQLGTTRRQPPPYLGR